jgi:hypothetical protein
MPPAEQPSAPTWEQNKDWIKAQPGIVGFAEAVDAQGRKVHKIYTDRLSGATREAILSRLEGVPVVFQETGQPRLLGTARRPPVP